MCLVSSPSQSACLESHYLKLFPTFHPESHEAARYILVSMLNAPLGASVARFRGGTSRSAAADAEPTKVLVPTHFEPRRWSPCIGSMATWIHPSIGSRPCVAERGGGSTLVLSALDLSLGPDNGSRSWRRSHLSSSSSWLVRSFFWGHDRWRSSSLRLFSPQPGSPTG